MNGKWYKKIGNGQKRANSIRPYVKHQTISMASCLESGFNRISRIKENVFGLNLKVIYKLVTLYPFFMLLNPINAYFTKNQSDSVYMVNSIWILHSIVSQKNVFNPNFSIALHLPCLFLNVSIKRA